MKTFKGLVIREKGRGESSKSITVLCADNGIIDIFVRGGMKSQKSSSATQVFSYSPVLYRGKKKDARGHVNYFLNSAESINIFYELRLDVKKHLLPVISPICCAIQGSRITIAAKY